MFDQNHMAAAGLPGEKGNLFGQPNTKDDEVICLARRNVFQEGRAFLLRRAPKRVIDGLVRVRVQVPAVGRIQGGPGHVIRGLEEFPDPAPGGGLGGFAIEPVSGKINIRAAFPLGNKAAKGGVNEGELPINAREPLLKGSHVRFESLSIAGGWSGPGKGRI
ncbi:MAG: type VI secretion system baseplate subunit TssF [Alphaproteobacteria bacterium]|nr:type VI secretion system baseplate subunit TssF [Alphaproteobacteria bacterium]